MKTIYVVSLLVFACLAGSTCAQTKDKTRGVIANPDPAKEGVDAKLPNVLIIGDSISLGYTPYVVETLKSKVNIFHSGGLWNENASSSSFTLGRIDAWLAFRDIKCKTAPPRPGAGKIEIHNPTVDYSAYELKWDVIACNFGLWEIINDGKPTNAVSVDQYQKNLKVLFEKMKTTQAELIWATTTPVPPVNKRKRKAEDVIAYNAAAQKIVDSFGATTVDLYALVKFKLTDDWRRGGNPEEVHFADVGNRFLADHLVKGIEVSLGRRKPK